MMTNPLLDHTPSMANHMLAMGRATADHAREYAARWNSVKVSTAATVIGGTDAQGFRVPVIVVVDI